LSEAQLKEAWDINYEEYDHLLVRSDIVDGQLLANGVWAEGVERTWQATDGCFLFWRWNPKANTEAEVGDDVNVTICD
jgi:hypothetical protein